MIYFVKKIIYRIYFKSAYSLLKGEERFECKKKSGVNEPLCEINWIYCKFSAVFDTSLLP